MLRTFDRFAAVFVFLLFANSSVASAATSANKLVIGAWVGPHQSEQQYLLYKAAGFNSVLDYIWEGDDFKKTIALSKKVGGLDVYLNLDQMFLRKTARGPRSIPRDAIRNFVSMTNRAKTVAGFLLFDEHDPQILHVIATIVTKSSRKPLWVNFQVEDHLATAHALLGQTALGAISMDYYPFREKKTALKDYYRFLGKFRDVSLKHGVPFWMFYSVRFLDRC
jgi:hypothetical protein